jgi:hypothetical protein
MLSKSVRRLGALVTAATVIMACIAPTAWAAAAERDSVSSEAKNGATATAEADQRFWSWFAAHDDMLFDWTSSPMDEKRRERALDQVGDALHKVDPELYFLIGPNRDGKREFIITGEGRPRLIPIVQRLTHAAPPLDRWIIIAFTQRNPHPLSIAYQDVRLCPCETSFTADRYGDRLQLSVFVPDRLMDRGAAEWAVKLLIDDVLGELDVMTRIRGVDIFPASRADPQLALPITSLPRVVDGVFKEDETKNPQ